MGRLQWGSDQCSEDLGFLLRAMGIPRGFAQRRGEIWWQRNWRQKGGRWSQLSSQFGETRETQGHSHSAEVGQGRSGLFHPRSSLGDRAMDLTCALGVQSQGLWRFCLSAWKDRTFLR